MARAASDETEDEGPSLKYWLPPPLSIAAAAAEPWRWLADE
jgi:hypothetical protein